LCLSGFVYWLVLMAPLIQSLGIKDLGGSRARSLRNNDLYVKYL